MQLTRTGPNHHYMRTLSHNTAALEFATHGLPIFSYRYVQTIESRSSIQRHSRSLQVVTRKTIR